MLARRFLLGLLGAYSVAISPLLGRNCRFHPSCSEYARDAVRKYGAWQGVMLALRRLSRCHPWNQGGYDPVV
ncbi:MAG: membrane protein insertion efficiency factor YidD [Betaproteobacteria bacterium]|nr:membrane protein insertion efficiency factor YidD [Betaproteobacteria bacterium]